MVSIKLLKLSQNRSGRFRENWHFDFGGQFDGPIFLELECSYSPDIDLWFFWHYSFLLGLRRLLQFFWPYTQLDSLDGGSARHKAAIYTQNNTNTEKTHIIQTPMPWVGFERTIPSSERAKTVHVLDRAAIVIGDLFTWTLKCWIWVKYVELFRRQRGAQADRHSKFIFSLSCSGGWGFWKRVYPSKYQYRFSCEKVKSLWLWYMR
jgi:hypothetical protein